MLPIAASVTVLVAGMLVTSPRGLAQPGASFDPGRIKQGLAIAPVPLNYPKELRNLVGFGSWLVNAVADCNGCHNGGSPPNFNYAQGGNPYFSQPTKVDPTVYLAGGQDFGQVAIDANFNPIGPHIISRNLPRTTPGGRRAATRSSSSCRSCGTARTWTNCIPLLDRPLQPELPFCSRRNQSGGWQPAPGHALACV